MSSSEPKERVEITLFLSEDSTGMLFRKVRWAAKQHSRTLKLNLVGQHHLKQDTILILWEILSGRDQTTKLITHTHSSVFDGTLLLWLMGDERIAREHAWFQIDSPKRLLASDHDDFGLFDEENGKFSPLKKKIIAPYTKDYLKIASLMDSYIPVEQLSDAQIDFADLEDYGLLFSTQEEEQFQKLFKAA